MNLPNKRLRIAVLISGGGSTLKNLIDLAAEKKLDIDIVYVVSSNSKATGLNYAKEAGIPSDVVLRKPFNSDDAFSEAIYKGCRKHGVELIVMGGFMKKITVPEEFENKIINVHPSLIPAFCGEGFYGLRVHQAVLEYGCRISGCTVHFVDNEYDHGPIILQQPVEVLDGDTAEVLAARVQAAERQVYPVAIQQIIDGSL